MKRVTLYNTVSQMKQCETILLKYETQLELMSFEY